MPSDARDVRQPPAAGRPAERLRPDGSLVRSLIGSGGEKLRSCMQCATCSAVCGVTSGTNPTPRKEMLWAQWGLRDRLMRDPDLWLCHHCGDCTVRCPRGARPGDVMAALRREAIVHYTVPRTVGRWLSRPGSLPWLLAGAGGLLSAASTLWARYGMAPAWSQPSGGRLALSFWSLFPYGLLVTLFSALGVVDLVILVLGAAKLWRALHSGSNAGSAAGVAAPPSSPWGAALRRIVWHDDFEMCTTSQRRRLHHALVFYGMIALGLTDLWVVTARYNPMLQGLVCPLGLFDPWKVLANVGGLAVAAGTTLMIRERWRSPDAAGGRTYADFLTVGLLLAAALTGFATEALHFARIDSLRYAAYATHLTTLVALFVALPYTKLAHGVYRTVALVFAERAGRKAFRRDLSGVGEPGAGAAKEGSS